MKEIILKSIKDSVSVKNEILANSILLENIEKAAMVIIDALKNGNKVIFCGNGGSAADAQHLAAELMGKFNFEREPLPALSLTVNTSVITAIGNDYSFDDIFLRQLKGIRKRGDVLVGISTSGNSKNVLNTFIYAKNNNIFTISLTGENGGKIKEYSDILINVPSNKTPRIQESHILIGHIICDLVERNFVEVKNND